MRMRFHCISYCVRDTQRLVSSFLVGTSWRQELLLEDLMRSLYFS